jgi:stage II sporulation protein D
MQEEIYPIRKPGWTHGREIAAFMAVLLMVCAMGAIFLSCCMHRRLLPPVKRPAWNKGPLISVRLRQGISSSTVTTGSPSVVTTYGGDLELPESGAGEYEIRSLVGRLWVNGRELSSRRFLLKPPGGVFTLEGKRYRGDLRVELADGGDLILTERVNLEDYLRGVVPREMSDRWPMAALEAQAVAARTFAIHHVQSSTHRTWLSATDMAYGGMSAETERTDEAVRNTSSIVLKYENEVLPAYFHSTCGGHTAPADRVFSHAPVRPLGGVRCRWCEDSPQFNWHAEIDRADLADALKQWGIKEVQSLAPLEQGPGGRVYSLLVNGRQKVDAAAFRLAAGPARLKSTMFHIVPSGDSILFVGHGWGHGVGLCQWGAHGMAREGYSCQEILNYYYPGAELAPIRPDRSPVVAER